MADDLSNTFQERALISNYQRLGVYEDDPLTILAPVKQMTVITDPLYYEQSIQVDPGNGNVLEAMAFYQGADFVLAMRLNRWGEVEAKDIGEQSL